jgi:CRP/FNR family cyclic AMP-dependent transcriptional regulator
MSDDRQEAVRAALRAHPFVQGVDAASLERLLPHGRLLEVPAGALVAREGDVADSFDLLVDGRVAVELDTPTTGPVRLQTIGAGEVLGWEWLSSPRRRQFDVRALEPARLVALDAETARAACAADPALGRLLLHRLLETVARRLVASHLQLVDVYR